MVNRLRCSSCGRPVYAGLGCHYCATLSEFWHQCQRDHPELPRELCILIGSMVSGMVEALVREHGRGRIPTEGQFERAVDLAAQYMKSRRYVLPKDVDRANAVNPTDTESREEPQHKD